MEKEAMADTIESSTRPSCLKTGTEGACTCSEPYDDLFVSTTGTRTKLRFVAWIDIMGGKSFMWRSMSTCAIFIGKLYDAVDKARKYFSIPDDHVFRMGDGVYICGEKFNDVRGIVERVMRSCAYDFRKEDRDDNHRFLLRSAIAYGNTIIGRDVQEANQRKGLGGNHVFLSMIIGAPVAWANEAERKAPPFGIFLHESCRSFQISPSRNIGWVLNKWWRPDGKDFAHDFGSELLVYLGRLMKNKIETGIVPEKAMGYCEAIKEYFELPDDENNMKSNRKEISEVNNNEKETK